MPGKDPYAYLRKSRVMRPTQVTGPDGRPVFLPDGKPLMTKPRVISPEMQLAEVKDLAKRHDVAPDTLIVLQDMNISGRKGRNKRPDFNRLMTAIEQGEVSALFSYSLSRLSRKVADIIALFELCAQMGVPVYLAKDVSPDPSTATGRLLLALLAAMAQFESDVTSERMTDIAEFRRTRGDKLGGHYFEAPEKVRDAFLQAGTLAGAARLLKTWGIKTRNKNDLWSATAVKGILVREYPEVAPVNPTRGAKSRAPFWFYRMVLCHCGRVMTGRRDNRRPAGSLGAVRYICLAGRLDPDHGRAYIAEPVVRQSVDEALAEMELPFDAVASEQAEYDKVALVELRARRERTGWAMINGAIKREAALAELERIDDEMAQLELAGMIERVDLTVDWDRPEDANALIRLLFEPFEATPEMTIKPPVPRVKRMLRPRGPHALSAAG